MKEVSLDTIPATMADVVIAFGALTIELAAQLAPTSDDASEMIIQIGNRLLDMERGLVNPRSRLLISALASHLISTEPGA